MLTATSLMKRKKPEISFSWTIFHSITSHNRAEQNLFTLHRSFTGQATKCWICHNRSANLPSHTNSSNY